MAEELSQILCQSNITHQSVEIHWKGGFTVRANQIELPWHDDWESNVHLFYLEWYVVTTEMYQSDTLKIGQWERNRIMCLYLLTMSPILGDSLQRCLVCIYLYIFLTIPHSIQIPWKLVKFENLKKVVRLGHLWHNMQNYIKRNNKEIKTGQV